MHPVDPYRRRLFRAAGATGLAAALPLRVEAQAAGPYLFFAPAEAAFIEAAVARLIPADELGPGALEAGVPSYIDRQLAGPWGKGARLYRSGPWRKGEPTQGYQLPYAPAELFRVSLREVDAQFVKKTGQEQDEALKALEQDHEFLLQGDVFTMDVLETWLEMKREADVDPMRMRPHPYEFALYFDV